MTISLLVLSIFGCNRVENTITLIPNNYKGTVRILFDQQDGEEKLYEGNVRIYRIPSDGVLKTQFTKQFGWHYPEYYYETLKNERIPIIPLIQINDSILKTLESDKIYAYHFWNQGNTIKIDSLGNETDLNTSAIIFTVGNPLND